VLARPVISDHTLVVRSGASRADNGQPGTSCVSAAGRSADDWCARGEVFREVNCTHLVDVLRQSENQFEGRRYRRPSSCACEVRKKFVT